MNRHFMSCQSVLTGICLRSKLNFLIMYCYICSGGSGLGYKVSGTRSKFPNLNENVSTNLNFCEVFLTDLLTFFSGCWFKTEHKAGNEITTQQTTATLTPCFEKKSYIQSSRNKY